MLNCCSYVLIIIFAHFLIGSWYVSIALWEKYSLLFLSLIVSADALAIISVVQAYKARGNRTWVLRVATPIISIVSILATLGFPYGN